MFVFELLNLEVMLVPWWWLHLNFWVFITHACAVSTLVLLDLWSNACIICINYIMQTHARANELIGVYREHRRQWCSSHLLECFRMCLLVSNLCSSMWLVAELPLDACEPTLVEKGLDTTLIGGASFSIHTYSGAHRICWSVYVATCACWSQTFVHLCDLLMNFLLMLVNQH